VSLMKPIPELDALLDRAVMLGVAGTKMRSTIRLADRVGIAAAARQQFELGERIAAYGLLPILEPEVLVKSPDKAGAESLLRDELKRGLDALPGEWQVMLKLTIPEQPNFYRPLIEHPRVARVVALSGGYDRSQACGKLVLNGGLIGSFSRALLQDLRHQMPDPEFDAALGAAADEIYSASVDKL
jgi:fructose-bisphosphate aldolase class I